MKRRMFSKLALGAVAGLAFALPAVPAMADVNGHVSGIGGRWAAMSGSSLRETLDGWARESGWTLDWKSDYDYRLSTSITFSGGFEEAVERLINGIYRQHPEINAVLHTSVRVLTVDDSLVSN